MNSQKALECILNEIADGVVARAISTEECIIRMPFRDGAGDPIELSVDSDGSQATIDDVGAIAGLLFSLGQHTHETPAFRLLKALEKAHELDIDFDSGLVKVSVPESKLYEGITELTKVILTLHTVVPHIRVSPKRIKPLGATRLKSKIRRQYRDLQVLDLVEPDLQIDGLTVQGWPVDFHWSLQANGAAYDIDVITTDLRVAEPLERAQRIAAFSMDTQDRHATHSGSLRVVIETPIEDPKAVEAAGFIRQYSERLKYQVFDFNQPTERAKFFTTSVDELTGEAGTHWRRFWRASPNVVS